MVLCRGVLLTDESWFPLFMAERRADVSDVDRATRGGGGVVVWAGVSYGQCMQFLEAENIQVLVLYVSLKYLS